MGRAEKGEQKESKRGNERVTRFFMKGCQEGVKRAEDLSGFTIKKPDHPLRKIGFFES